MRVVSHNLQAAVGTNRYWRYFTRAHHQILPTPQKTENLTQMAYFLSDFDVACVQEVDLGGWRNGFRHQARDIANIAMFPYSIWQINRVVGRFSVHGNAIFSRFPLREIINGALPSRIKGRGMLAVMVDNGAIPIVVANVHLSLGRRDQMRQIHFICAQLQPYPNVCLMGDFNAVMDSQPLKMLAEAGYIRLDSGATYPSWQPFRALDHIWVKGDISGGACVEKCTLSDHLPVSARLILPASGSLKHDDEGKT